MLVRIVKMTFREDKVDEFLKLFDLYKNEIRNSEGCSRLELLRDQNHNNVFFTYSFWEGQKELDNYRFSDTFGKVWPATKKLFLEKPEAWSTSQEHILP